MPSPSPEQSTPSVTPQQLQLESERMQEVVLLVDNLLRQEETSLGLIVDCLYDIGSVRLIHKKLNLPFLQGATKGVARVSKPLFRLLALRWIKKNCPELLAKWLYSKVIFEDEAASPPPPQVEASPEASPLPNIKEALENPNPIEEIAEQISSPPPLPAVVETAIEARDVPALPPTADRPSSDTVEAPPEVASNASSQEQEIVAVEAAPPPMPIAPTISLEEYNRAIAQIKFRDTEISKLQTRSKVLAGLLVVVSVALGGALFWPLYGEELGVPSKAEPVQSRN